MWATAGSISKNVQCWPGLGVVRQGAGPQADDADALQARVLRVRQFQQRPADRAIAMIVGQRLRVFLADAFHAVYGVAVNEDAKAVRFGDAVDAEEAALAIERPAMDAGVKAARGQQGRQAQAET